MVRTLQGFSQEPSVHKVSGVFARASPARLCLRSAAHQGFRREKEQKKGSGKRGGLGGGVGKLRRPGLGRRPGLAEFPAWRPPLGLGFASASAGVMQPSPSVAPAPFLSFPAARWARARPPPSSFSQRPGEDLVGAGAEGGRRRGGRPAELRGRRREKAPQSCRNLLPPPLSWEFRAQLREVGGATLSPAAFHRPLKFAGTMRTALTPGALGA